MTTQIGNCGSALNTPIMSFVLNTLSGNFAPVNTVCIFIPLFGLGVSISSIRFVRSMKRAKSATPQLPSDVIRTESALSDVDLDVITVEGRAPDDHSDHEHDHEHHEHHHHHEHHPVEVKSSA